MFTCMPVYTQKTYINLSCDLGEYSVSIDASDCNFRYYRNGVYCNQECSKTDLNHSLLVVGYGTDGNQDYWILKNRCILVPSLHTNWLYIR